MARARPVLPVTALVAAASAVGLAIVGVGFRLTDEVIVVAVGFLGAAFLGGAFVGRRSWLWGFGMGVGSCLSHLYPPPPYVPDARHLALYGPPKPLPLPLGLTSNAIAQYAAASLIFIAAPTIAAGVGWLLGELPGRLDRL
ncbi:MAG: hypothetical protein ACHQO8_12150 [Vicinamibacterales bacterium]